MEKRTGIIGIFLEARDSVPRVNELFGQHAELILARMGLPIRENGLNVIALIVQGTTDEMGALTGKLGRLKGVSVKSMLSKSGGYHDPDQNLHFNGGDPFQS